MGALDGGAAVVARSDRALGRVGAAVGDAGPARTAGREPDGGADQSLGDVAARLPQTRPGALSGGGTLWGSRALVTGAARGIGEAVAIRLAREGGLVTAADVSAEPAWVRAWHGWSPSCWM